MIIDLTKSKLFTSEPHIRFAREYNVHNDIWLELWKRYKLMGYTLCDMRDFYHIKTGNHIKNRNLKRWILRTEIYTMVYPALREGAQFATTEIFGEYEQYVIDEVIAYLKVNGTAKNRIML